MSNKKDEIGHIYIASNPAMPGIVKIGYTAIELDTRLEQLSKSTSVPLDFKLEYSKFVEQPAKIERLLHAKLTNYRVNPKREFFKVSPDHADDELRRILFGTTVIKLEDEIKLLMHIFENYKDRFAPLDKSKMANAVIRLFEMADIKEWNSEKKQNVIDQLKLIADE